MSDVNSIAKAICRETCAFLGEPPCWKVEGQWPNPNCNDPGCQALAQAACSIKPIAAGSDYADLIKRLYVSEEGWYDEHAPGTPFEARNSVMRDAAQAIERLAPAPGAGPDDDRLALRNEVEALRAALKRIIEAHDQYKADCPNDERDPIYDAIEAAR